MDVRDEVSIIERAIVQCLQLGYGFRYPAVETPDDLRALKSISDTSIYGIPSQVTFCVNGGLIFVNTVGRVYMYDGYSQAIDDNHDVITPNDMTIDGRGRWIKQDSKVTLGPNFRKPLHVVRDGYAKAVELYEGQLDLDEELIRILGVCPAFLVHWVGDDYETKSIRQGALYLVKHKFKIICISSCLRPDSSALYGSSFPTEKAYDPGLNRMMGDVRYLFAGSDLGLPTVDYTIPGPADIIHEDWDSRLFAGEVELVVRDTVNIADEDLLEFRDLAVIPHLTESKNGEFNINSYIYQGLRVPIKSGLTISPQAGSAYIDNELIYVNPPINKFPVDSDTYRDLDKTGKLIYSSVGRDKDPPLQPSDTLRVGITITDSTDIIFDNYLADSNVPYGDPYIIKQN